MNIILFGATGMVGRGALIECLEDETVTSVLVVGRSSCGVRHAKLEEVLHDNFMDFTPVQAKCTGRDVCFYCVGVSSLGMSADKYLHLTYSMTMSAAESVLAMNPSLVFCFISGQGADSSENGRVAWANVKGKTENGIGQLPFKASYIFRPGAIQPLKGVTSRTPSYRVMYAIIGPVIPLLLRIFPRFVTTSERIGRALIHVANHGYATRILENSDINRVAV
jgi:hypothetical protein